MRRDDLAEDSVPDGAMTAMGSQYQNRSYRFHIMVFKLSDGVLQSRWKLASVVDSDVASQFVMRRRGLAFKLRLPHSDRRTLRRA